MLAFSRKSVCLLLGSHFEATCVLVKDDILYHYNSLLQTDKGPTLYYKWFSILRPNEAVRTGRISYEEKKKERKETTVLK